MSHDLPRVTAILRDAEISGDPTHVPESALHRGTAVHLACEYLDQGDLDFDSLDPRVAPSVRQYERFLAEMKPEVLANEESVCNEALGYRGTLDRRFRINGEEWLVDLKNGLTCAPFHGPQTAAYAGTFDRPMRRACLHLGEDRYQLIEHTSRDDWKVFCAALTVTRWRREHV